MQYSYLTLKFTGDDEHLEAAFLNHYFDNSLTLTRICMLFGIVVYGCFGILDAYRLPHRKYDFWLMRYVLICPRLLAAFVFSFFKPFRRYWQQTIAAVVIAAGLGIIVMICKAPQPVAHSYYAGLILVLIFCATFIRARFIWASLTCWFIIISYEVTAIFILQTPFPILINNNFFIITANLIALFACYYAEYYARRNFYLIHLLEAEKEFKVSANRELQEKIREIKEASAKIKVLGGLIPICSNCKNIRDDKGYWNQLETYVKEHSEAEFSHGICPECAMKLYPEIYNRTKKAGLIRPDDHETP